VCDTTEGFVVKSGKLEATVEGLSNELELSTDDPRNKTMEGVSEDMGTCGGGMGKMHLTGEHFMVPELHMTRYLKSSGNGVIAVITFLSDVITNEATQARVRFKFGTLMWRKSDKINTTKDAKQRIVECATIQTLIRSLVVSSRGRHMINHVNNNESSLTLKTFRK
jgi:hypothetical protein